MIDASGSPRAVQGLLDIAAKGGTVVYGAMYPADFEMPLNLSDYLYLKELTLTGVFVSPYAFPRALQVLPHLDLDELTAAVFDLEDAAEAFEAHIERRAPQGRHPLQRLSTRVRRMTVTDGACPARHSRRATSSSASTACTR